MSKYYKAEDVIRAIDDAFDSIPMEQTTEILQARRTIRSLPTIEIVHCKECEHYYNKDPERIPTASIMCSHMHPDDFCSYGERIDNE